MPVDKFGRSRVGGSSHTTCIVSSGLTPTQATNLFLRRDGVNGATADISMGSHKLTNVADPMSDQDAATKKFVTDRISLPHKKFLAPYATDLNTYNWKEYQYLPDGLTEAEFDDLPAGFYACFTGYIPASRLGSLPTSTKGYLIAITYQQPVDRNKYYRWINSTNGDEWVAYFKDGAWTTWVASNKVSKSGDTMTGDLTLTTSTQNSTRNLGCKTITNGQTFNLWLGSPNVRLAYTDFLKYLDLAIDGGFQIAKAGNILFNIGVNPDPVNAATFYVPIDMGGRAIVDVADPTNAQDVSTKNYSDAKDALRVLKSGDTMTGDLLLSSAVQPKSTVRKLGCTNIQEGTGFSLILGNNFNKIDYEQVLDRNPVIFQTSGGLLVTVFNNDIIQLGNKDLTPLIIVHTDIAMNSHKIKNLPTPVNSDEAATKGYTDTKVAKTGDAMTGNLSLSVGGDLLRTLGCSDLSGSKGFSILLGSIMNQIQCQLDTPITLQTTDGFLCRSAGKDIARFGLSSSDNRIGVYRDIVMNQNFIADLHDPNTDKDAANKIYVDASGYMTAYPTMTSNTTTVDGLTYTASASSIVNGMYQPWQSFQNVVVIDGWVATPNANQWIQMQYPSPISMSGFNIVARNVAGRNITSWKVQASNDGIAFTDIVPTNNTVFNAGVLNKFTFTASAKYLYWRYFIISSVGSIDVGIGMLQWIPTLTDRYLKKCHVGYVPRLTSNVNYKGFTPCASSELNSSYIAANAFKGDYVDARGAGGEWATVRVSSNFWIMIECPTAVRTWKFGFRGRDSNTERIFNWRIEGSTDDKHWVILYTAPNPTYLGSKYQEFLVDSIGKFQHYRLYCVNSEASNPGLSVMQLFVYDD